jgi:hypothetical protein
MKLPKTLIWLIFSVAIVGPVIAATQAEICSQVVKEALEATNKICDAATRNQACYGHLSLEAQPQDSAKPFKFDSVGDRVDVSQLKSLRLSPMDLDKGNWGVALMRLKANIPNSQPNANVSLLLFGDVEIENAVDTPVFMQAVSTSPSNLNVRRRPLEDGFVIGTIKPGEAVTVRGISEDRQWYYIDMPDKSARGWINHRLMNPQGDENQLKIVKPALTQYGPMQAFYLRTGRDASTCDKAPNDGILVQTPEGVAEVRLWINEVKIRLGSTAYIQAEPGKEMKVSTVEGKAKVEAMGIEYTAPAGTSVTIPMKQDLQPAAPPSPPVPYKTTEVQNLPVKNLSRPIEVAAPKPTSEIDQTPVTVDPTEDDFEVTDESTSEAISTQSAQSTVTPGPASTQNGSTPTEQVTAAPPATSTSVPVDTNTPPATQEVTTGSGDSQPAATQDTSSSTQPGQVPPLPTQASNQVGGQQSPPPQSPDSGVSPSATPSE